MDEGEKKSLFLTDTNNTGQNVSLSTIKWKTKKVFPFSHGTMALEYKLPMKMK